MYFILHINTNSQYQRARRNCLRASLSIVYFLKQIEYSVVFRCFYLQDSFAKNKISNWLGKIDHIFLFYIDVDISIPLLWCLCIVNGNSRKYNKRNYINTLLVSNFYYHFIILKNFDISILWLKYVIILIVTSFILWLDNKK